MKFDILQTLHILFKDKSQMNNSILNLADIEVFHINWARLSLTLLLYVDVNSKIRRNVNDHFAFIPKMGILCIWYIFSMYDCLRLSTTT